MNVERLKECLEHVPNNFEIVSSYPFEEYGLGWRREDEIETELREILLDSTKQELYLRFV